MKYRVTIEKRYKVEGYYKYKVTVESDLHRKIYFCNNFPKLYAKNMIKEIEAKRKKVKKVIKYEVEQ